MILSEDVASVDLMDRVFRVQPVDLYHAGCRMISASAGDC